MNNEPPLIDWPKEGPTRAPYRVINDPEVYALDQERIVRGPTWHHLCLDVDGTCVKERIVVQESRRVDTLLVIPL